LCIVSGGPGNGKTTTVVKVLALLLSLHPALRVALAAPTGKAAARLQGSLRDQLAGLPVAAEAKARLPAEAYTVHRLLGHRPGRVSFRHDREHPLPYDLVVVDEASMLDLALATKLVEALPDDGRLILLGDKDQLSAVETGTVFANLSVTRGMGVEMRENVEALTDETLPETEIGAAQGLSDAVVWLEQGHRYVQGGAIGALVGRVREGEAEAVLAWLAPRSGEEVGSEGHGARSRASGRDAHRGLRRVSRCGAKRRATRGGARGLRAPPGLVRGARGRARHRPPQRAPHRTLPRGPRRAHRCLLVRRAPKSTQQLSDTARRGV
jgi:AAA domain